MSQNQQSWTSELSAETPSVPTTSNLRRELWKLSRGRRLVVASFLVCMGLAAVYNYGSRPLYQSVSVVSLDEAGVTALKARGAVDQTRKAAALARQVLLLRSRELALMVVKGADPAITRELALGPLGDWKARISEEARFRLGFPRRHGTELPQLVETFLSRLTVDYEPPETWVHVRLTGYDPKATALALNRLTDIYVEETAKETAGAAGTSKEQLEKKVAERQGRVVETIGKLQTYEEEQGLQNLNVRRDLLRQEIARLQDSLLSVRQARQSRRTNFEESQRLTVEQLVAIPSVRDDGEVSGATRKIAEIQSRIAQAASTFGDLHPEIVTLRAELDFTRKTLNTRLAALREGMNREYQASLRDESDIATALGNAQTNLARLDRNSAEHSFIQKQAEAGQLAVGELIARSVRESDEEVFFAPVVLQRAEPAALPESPQRARNFQLAAVIALALGLSLAWVRVHLDETLKTPEEVKAAIGLPLMGMVPQVTASKFDLFAQEQASSTRLFEAYRVLRTNLTRAGAATRRHEFVLITSSREAEGKTTTSSGLAVTLARAGHRVLLVDGDLRRASLSRLLSATGRWGLTDAAEGRDLEDCIAETVVPGLSIMPSGTPRPDPAEILDRDSLVGVVERIRQRFDWILCDAPPVLAVADAAILCRLADSVLVVIGANSTPLGTICAGLDQLTAAGAKVSGLVLNNVDLSRDSHYYKYYYSAQYGDYSKASETGDLKRALSLTREDRG